MYKTKLSLYGQRLHTTALLEKKQRSETIIKSRISQAVQLTKETIFFYWEGSHVNKLKDLRLKLTYSNGVI